jgi:hypothetical protein
MVTRCSLFRTAIPAAIALLLYGGAEARSDFVTWQVEVLVQDNMHSTSNLVGIALLGQGGATHSGSARIDLIAVQFTDDRDRTGRSSVAVTDDYLVSVFFTDKATIKSSNHLAFAGHMTGQIGASHPVLTNQFLAPTTQSTTLGGNVFTISLDPFTSPTVKGFFHDEIGGDVYEFGTMTAFVDVRPAANNTPEPSCLALAGLGLGCLAAARFLRRRWRRPAVTAT